MSKMTLKQNFNVTYKDVTYNVSLNTTNNELYVNGSYLCPFQYTDLDWRDKQLLIDEIYDCIGGWVEGYEIYSLRAHRGTTIRKSILEWNEILENNPSFDDVYDYIQSTFIAGTGKPFEITCEGDKKFLEYMCESYLNKNKK